MSAIKLSTPSSGSISLSPANTASNLTITVPAVTGTMAIQGPTFSAYASASQTLAANTWTKIQFNTEDWDTANCYDNATNYRFTPTVAGYYQVNGYLGFNTTNTAVSNLLAIYKNGTSSRLGYVIAGQSSSFPYTGLSAIVYLNGSTDYIECYAFSTGASTPTSTGSSIAYFQASMVRAA